MKINIKFLPVILFAALQLQSQSLAVDSKALSASLKRHIATLASDTYEGRETGTKGEQMAVDYISKEFKGIGLQPKGENGFVQKFTFVDGVKYEAQNNKLLADNAQLAIDKDFYPLAY